MFGQFGHFYKYAKEKVDYGINRYQTETLRLLGVLEKRLEGRDFLIGGDYTIADMATFPWVGALDWGYEAAELLKLKQNFPSVVAWYERCRQRPATARGLEVTKLN